MKTWIASLMILSLAFAACTPAEEAPVEEMMEESEEVVNLDDVVLAEETKRQKVSFASEDVAYLYSFEYDMDFIKYLGYPLEGMSQNGGAFRVSDGSEIVTSTTEDDAIGIEAEYGDFVVLESEENKDECSFQYRVVEQEGQNLVLRAKSCEENDVDSASKALDMMLWSLSIDAI